MFVVRVNVFENEENAKALKKNINNYFPAYTEVLPNNSDLTAVYVGPFRTKGDIDNNIEFIYEISETNSGVLQRVKKSYLFLFYLWCISAVI